MGSIECTPSGTWKARYRDLQGRSRRKHFKVRRDAELFLAAMQVDRHRGLWIDPAAEIITPAGQRGREVVPCCWQRRGPIGLASDTSAVNRRFRVLRMVMGTAVAAEVIARSPTTGIMPPPVPVREMRFLSAGEVRALAEAMHPWFRTWVYFAAYTGLRWSEMLGLRRRDIDLVRGRVRVQRQVIEVQSRFVEFGPLKTAASRRSVTLPGFLVEMLSEQLTERAQPGADGLVFVNTAGHTPHASSFRSQLWAGACRRAGVRWHDLRHAAVALAIERGAHAKAIQERMGHSSIKVTLDRYGHILPTIEQRIADGLDDSYHQALKRPSEDTARAQPVSSSHAPATPPTVVGK